MGYGRRYGLGFLGPRTVINGGSTPVVKKFITESGFAKRPAVVPSLPPSPRVQPSPPRMAPPLHMPPELDLFVGHDPSIAARYSPEQIKEMLQRGASETVERSGESDGGGPADGDMMQLSREADATAIFEDGAGTGYKKVAAEPGKANWLPLALLAAAGYFILG